MLLKKLQLFKAIKARKMALQSALPAAVNHHGAEIGSMIFSCLLFDHRCIPRFAYGFAFRLILQIIARVGFHSFRQFTVPPVFGKADTGRTRRSQAHCTALVLTVTVTALTLIYILFDISIEGIETLCLSYTSALCSFNR